MALKNFAGTRLTTSICQVASLETDTASELKETTRAINSIDKNLEQRFEDFKAKFHKQMVAFEKKVKLESIHLLGCTIGILVDYGFALVFALAPISPMFCH